MRARLLLFSAFAALAIKSTSAGHGTPIHVSKSSGAIAADGSVFNGGNGLAGGFETYKRVKAFQKIRHPNDIIASMKTMMGAPTIGEKDLTKT